MLATESPDVSSATLMLIKFPSVSRLLGTIRAAWECDAGARFQVRNG